MTYLYSISLIFCTTQVGKHYIAIAILLIRVFVIFASSSKNFFNFRKLHVNGKFIALKALPALAALDGTHFLCHVSYDELEDNEPNIEDLSDVYLFQLNVAQLQCTVLST